MSRPTRVEISTTALLHNLNHIKQRAPNKKVIAMVKANAYGCGIRAVLPVLEGRVDAFGVACLEEALAIRAIGLRTPCVLFEGVFSPDEINIALKNNCEIVIHQEHQLEWLLSAPLQSRIKVWVKVNTGMSRLGFPSAKVHGVISSLVNCPWVDKDIGLMTHFASADEPDLSASRIQMQCYDSLTLPEAGYKRSLANSAAILALPEAHGDVIRPGIMLYGISPFSHKTGQELGLRPVMSFMSGIIAINEYPKGAKIGYGGCWEASRPSRIGIVAVGYGDGYPRHIKPNTPVWIKGQEVPIVGRISMDMTSIDLTDFPDLQLGDPVELWGSRIPVETIAASAGTIPYELLCQLSARVHL